jgi:hypothetical protein
MKKIGCFSGIPLYTSEYLRQHEYRQRRVHRRSRINKKWRKKYGFVSIPIEKMYLINLEHFKLDFKPTFWIDEVNKELEFKNSLLKYSHIYIY